MQIMFGHLFNLAYVIKGANIVFQVEWKDLSRELKCRYS